MRPLCLAASLVFLVGCDMLDMYDQPRYEPLQASELFADGMSARPQVEGTVARGYLRDNEPLFTGKDEGKLISKIPDEVYRAIYDNDPGRFHQRYSETEATDLRLALLERGQERFNIYCSACHGRIGDGTGMVVQRGFRKPPSYHIDRLRNAPAGHFFDVITHGLGAMPSFANRVDVVDRWAIVAYIRALQLSQNARSDDIPADKRDTLSNSQPVIDGPTPGTLEKRP